MGEDSILKPMLQSTTKEINKNFKSDSQKLKIQASNFLKGVRSIISQYSNIRVLIKRTKTGIGSSIQKIYQAMKNSTQVTQKCITYQYNFESALNEFLGRQILLLYINEGELLYASEVKAAEIYRTAKAADRGKGSIDRNLQSELEKWPIEISEEYKGLIKQRQKCYEPIRDEVLNRWYKNHDSQNPWVIKNSKLLDTFYWYTSITVNGKKQWEWSKSMNRGHIYETYAHLIWQQEKIVNFGNDNPGQLDVKNYWDYMQSHKLLNSVAGIVEGDVSFFKDPSIQFAVKSGSFNTAALGSYLIVAYQLVYGNIDINEEMVLTLLGNLQSYSNVIRDKGLDVAQNQLKKYIEKIQN